MCEVGRKLSLGSPMFFMATHRGIKVNFVPKLSNPSSDWNSACLAFQRGGIPLRCHSFLGNIFGSSILGVLFLNHFDALLSSRVSDVP
jgi:hypothetical protein